MTCEQIKENVDATSLNEAVARHLSACVACRKETAATASLVSLLRAQPQVKAPADFMAQLQLRMATESVSADARLKSLLQAVPAVSAPPDFAFRVRARLAQAKADAPASNPLVWLQNWVANSFSFGQAATAMAAIALIAAFTTMQLRNDGATPSGAATGEIAIIDNSKAPQAAVADATANKALTVAKTVRGTVRPAFAKAPVTIPARVEVAVARALPTEMAEPAMYSPKSKQEVRIGRDGNAYGQQLRKMMDAQKAETMIAAF